MATRIGELGVTSASFLWLCWLPFRCDERVEPRDVALGGLGPVLVERAGVAVHALMSGEAAVADPREALDQLVPPALEEPEAGFAGEVAGEGELQVERALVVTRHGLGREQVCEQLLAMLGDAVHLAAAPARASRLTAGQERGGLACAR